MPTRIWHADSPFLGIRGWQHVDYLEKTSAAAKIPGGYFKREGTGCVLGLVLLGGRGPGGRGNDLAA
jgi:hypothetical protein